MEPREEKLTWETPVIEDYDIVESTGMLNEGRGSDGMAYEYS